LLPVPDEEDGVLYAGVPEQAGIVATGVTGYAWHDTEPSRLAYTTFTDGELVLWSLSEPAAEPQVVTRAVGIVGSVRAWGDWGFAIQDEERSSVVLLTDSGEIKTTHPGSLLDSDGAEWLAIAGDGVSLVSSGGGVSSGPEALDREVIAARFSPDGDELALISSDGAIVVSLVDGEVPVESAERPGVPEMVWTSDGRFAAYSGTSGILVMDTTDGSSTILLTERIFTGLGVLPVETS
jgi:WD40 repeat protein